MEQNSSPSPATLRCLTAADVETYQRQGFLLLHDVLDPDELKTFHAGVHQAWLKHRRRPPEEVDPKGKRTKEARENNMHGLEADFAPARRLLADERLLGPVGDLVGPGIGLYASKLIGKAPGDTRNVCHWHQDDPYWWETAPSQCRLSVWIPL